MSAGMSPLASPHQSVAQNTKLCSSAIALTLPAVTSSREPSRPCPYSEIRAGVAAVAVFGTTQ